MIHEDDGVRSSQVQTEASNARGQEEHVNARVIVERLNNGMTFPRVGGAVHAHVRHGGHELRKEVPLDQVKHRSELAEDEDAMLGVVDGLHSRLLGAADPAVCEKLARAVNLRHDIRPLDLPQRFELRGVADILQREVRPDLRLDRLESLWLLVEYEAGMITQFTKIL